MRYNPDIKVGLSTEEVNKRVSENLVNYNDQPPTKSIGKILRDNFFTYFNFINTVLAVAIIFAGIIGGELFEAIKNCTFMGVVIINSIISSGQEIISKRIIDKLSVLASSKIKTIRNSKEVLLELDEVVLDDVIKLVPGDQVICDSIIKEGIVEVNESFITGEVEPVIKKEGDLILSGSFIVSGTVYAQIEHIGKDNYISKISSEAKYNKKVNSVIMGTFVKILKVLSIVIVPVGALLFLNQFYITNSISDSIFNTVGALIGMIPDGLLLLTSSVLAVSVIRLAKYKVLVQQLYCTEVLARVDVICLDKTGTITEGKMELYDTLIENNNIDISLVLNNFCKSFDNENETLKAIREKYDGNKSWTVKSKLEFSSSRKFSAVEYYDHGTYYLGAPEYLLNDKFEEYECKLEEYADYRVLVLAHSNEEISEMPRNLDCISFLLIQDKIRKEAPETLKYFEKEGVKVKIISGDNFRTVLSVAKRAGLTDIKGMDASLLTDENIKEMVKTYDVFGRVKPEQKKKIIETLQSEGHTVAMTGDGVNDVLALKQADCSIALPTGSDAAKNVSELVLLDSNFSSMPRIVCEGRRSINNLERSASLLLIKTIFTAILVVICMFMKSEYFYLPIHLSLITTCTISIPSFILALEPNNERVKGNFLLKVVSKSVPPALTVVFNVILITLFKDQFNIDANLTSTLIVIMTGTTGFIFLFRLCKPFNLLRSVMVTTLIALFIYSLIFLYDFFDLSQITFKTILLYIVFLICSVHVYDRLNKFMRYLVGRVSKESVC